MIGLALGWLGSAMAAEPEVAPEASTTQADRFDNARMHAFVVRVVGDEAAASARQAPNAWEFAVEGHQVMIVTDERADRMRMMVPVASVEGLPDGLEQRMLQANFDAVLDARYAIARGMVWSVFIHPLSPVTDAELGSGLAQVVTAAATFGTGFTSGALVFGGGDSAALHADLYRRILEAIAAPEHGI